MPSFTLLPPASRPTLMRLAALALLLTCAFASARDASAQTPSPAAIAAAKELIAAKGATNMFDPVVPGVIETAKNMFLRTNPNLGKDLNEVAQKLRAQYEGKRKDVEDVLARTYAEKMTEKELKEAAAFYKSPLGQKIIVVEPQVLEQGMTNIQAWADNFSEQILTQMRAEMKKRGHTL
jgi:hypothetical protein